MPSRFADWGEVTTPRVSIIIPLYNRCDLTMACLQALEQATPPDLYEVVIVDNASTDGTAALLDALEGDVTLIRNADNLGFAKACNQGAAAARGELLCFLNNDTEVQEGWLTTLVEHLDREPGVAAVGGLLVYPDGRVQHAGVLVVENEVTGMLEVYHRALGMPAGSPEALARYEPIAVTGAAMLVRAEAFHAAGRFDESYWNGFEDIDLCLTLGAAGWRIGYEPTSLVVHHESASGQERHVGIHAGARRFTDRWRGKVTPDLVRNEAGPRPSPLAVSPANPEPELAVALVRLAQRAIRQHGAPLRFAGRDAELVLARFSAEASLRR